jgi:hypothetical protein
MDWAAAKAKLKAVVHQTFALPALYTRAAAGSVAFPVTARVNNDVRSVGGAGEQGFMQIIQDIPKLRIAITDLQGIAPKLDDRVDIPSENAVYVVRNVNPNDGAYYVVEVELA